MLGGQRGQPLAAVGRGSSAGGVVTRRREIESVNVLSLEFTRCISPTSYRLKKGKHVFRVAGRDVSGNTDASAATFSFEVKARTRHPRHRQRQH